MPKGGEPRFFVDESSVGLGLALAACREDVVHPGHFAIPEVPLGTQDVDWIPVVAQRGLVVIARDRHIKSNPAEKALFVGNKLRVFWIAGKKDLGNWENLCRLVRRWDQIEKAVAKSGPGPWFYGVHDAGLKDMPV